MNIIHTLFPQCAARPGPRPAWERPGAPWRPLKGRFWLFQAQARPGAGGASAASRAVRKCYPGVKNHAQREKSRGPERPNLARTSQKVAKPRKPRKSSRGPERPNLVNLAKAHAARSARACDVRVDAGGGFSKPCPSSVGYLLIICSVIC